MVKKLIKSLGASVGVEIQRKPRVPFGMSWERDVRWFLHEEKFRTAFDVGANIGQTATRLSAAFPAATIHSFEPVPSTFAVLAENMQDHPRVNLHNVALSDEPGQALMTNDPCSGQNTLRVAEKNGASTELVEKDTVDRFCQKRGIGSIDLLKVDTEGHEINVLSGATQMLDAGRVRLLLLECEFHSRSNEPHGDFFELYDFLKDYGYQVISFYTGGVDERGWIWGDVLLAHTRETPSDRASTTPLRR